MKNTSTTKSHRVESDDMRPEYSFDYRKARPNRFAGRIDKSHLVVTLDPDISEVFTTPESVNAVLRALIATMPATTKPKAVRKSSSKVVKKERA
jgi:predicted MarR family transcription regulator